MISNRANPTDVSTLVALTRQQRRLRRHIDRRQTVSNRYSWARVLVFLGGFLAAAVAFYTAPLWVSGTLLVTTLVLFGITVYRHQQVSRSLLRFETMLRLKEEQSARVQREWSTLPPPLQQELRFTHPFEADLDLLGHHSLHRLLDTAATLPGRQRLHSWLTTTTPPTQALIHKRQLLVQELMPRSLFRDRLTVQGRLLDHKQDETTGNWQPDRLLTWLQRHPTTANLRPWVWLLTIMAAINLLLFGAAQLELVGPLWRLTLMLYAVLTFWHAQTIAAAFHEAGTVQGELEQLLRVFRRLERYNYKPTPNLSQLCAPFHTTATRPSTHLQRIARIAAATGVQGNPVLALVLNAIGPWGLYFAWQLGQEKAQLSTLLPDWLQRWAELEALSSLATFGALNPSTVFPLLYSGSHAAQNTAETSATTSPIPFQVTGLGHPLLPNTEKVRNDFTFDALGSVVILTGSNMAGKSTFLKALALNLILAYAGGPVDAMHLETQRFRLFTCIKVSDSVTDGISYFYAEVRRLKALLDALDGDTSGGDIATSDIASSDTLRVDAKDGDVGAMGDAPLPLFYVIDEIFRGTNNRERLEGSRSYIRALAAKAGVGLVATHDLELVRLAEELPLIANYHFRDDIVDGEMHFDYRLRSGPSPTTNALKIMQHAGLPVDPLS